ncbi:hypothetical protein DFH08DRAFT_939354 [Mycena albidolilacea]|uniref:Uncharacterized protein n=1 Tax=Mycena albidolilacea TaxID=1033008 RepID=A0AAD6ZRQ0_9AGAR|nr:hypothetical protein DFH08DRAFT_939354 [Mycena albidolilacea]
MLPGWQDRTLSISVTGKGLLKISLRLNVDYANSNNSHRDFQNIGFEVEKRLFLGLDNEISLRLNVDYANSGNSHRDFQNIGVEVEKRLFLGLENRVRTEEEAEPNLSPWGQSRPQGRDHAIRHAFRRVEKLLKTDLESRNLQMLWVSSTTCNGSLRLLKISVRLNVDYANSDNSHRDFQNIGVEVEKRLFLGLENRARTEEEAEPNLSPWGQSRPQARDHMHAIRHAFRQVEEPLKTDLESRNLQMLWVLTGADHSRRHNG